MKLYIILPDIHDRPPNKKSLKQKVYHPSLLCAEKVMQALNPDGVVYLGDATDMESLSHFDIDKRRKMEGRRYKRDIDSLNMMLDRHMNICKGKEFIYLIGNHENRVESYLDYHSEADGIMDFINDAKLPERGMEVIPFNHSKKIGKALFIHGFDATNNHALKMSRLYPKTIFYGHTHDLQSASFTSPICHKEVRLAQSLGTLSDLNPQWLKNKPNKWINAFGLFYVKDNGQFQMDVKVVVNGETIIEKKVFKA